MATKEAVLDRELIISTARQWIGTPYVHQQSVKGAGCDCLGLIRGVWREIVGPEPETAPPYTSDWGERFGQEQLWQVCERHLTFIRKNDYIAGDVVLFRWRPDLPAKHCAIVSNDNHMIHALQNHDVQEVAIPTSWQRKIVAAFSFPGEH